MYMNKFIQFWVCQHTSEQVEKSSKDRWKIIIISVFMSSNERQREVDISTVCFLALSRKHHEHSFYKQKMKVLLEQI